MSIFDITVPIIMGIVGLCAVIGRSDAFPALTKGAQDGLRTVYDMLPALIVLFPAVYMLRASGALDKLSNLISPVFEFLGIPPETAPLALLRPISGSAATAAGADIISSAGADSLAGRTVAVMLGSSETTFYVIAVYFGAAGIKKTRWAIPAALCADLAVYFSAAWITRLLYRM